MKSFTLLATFPFLMVASTSFASCISLSEKNMLSTDDVQVANQPDSPNLMATGLEMRTLQQNPQPGLSFIPTGTVNRGVSLAVFDIDIGQNTDQHTLFQFRSPMNEKGIKQQSEGSIIKGQIKTSGTLRF